MNKERLLRLADRLDKVKDEHFNILNWYASPGSAFITYETRKKIDGNGTVKKISRKVEDKSYDRDFALLADEGFCGSTACVLGHAALIKDFNKEGLFVDVSSSRANVALILEDGKFLIGVEAGAAFFDLPESDAAAMFFTDSEQGRYFYGKDYCSSGGSITASDAAAAIRRYVETDGASMKEAKHKLCVHLGKSPENEDD